MLNGDAFRLQLKAEAAALDEALKEEHDLLEKFRCCDEAAAWKLTNMSHTEGRRHSDEQMKKLSVNLLQMDGHGDDCQNQPRFFQRFQHTKSMTFSETRGSPDTVSPSKTVRSLESNAQ